MKQRACNVPIADRTTITAGVVDRLGNAEIVDLVISARRELARLVLQVLSCGDNVATQDALQLRNWAARPEDSMLPLEELAGRILSHDENAIPCSLPENEEDN